MSYDLEIYDSDGTVLFNSSAFALRVTKVVTVNAGQQGSEVVPGYDIQKGFIALNGMHGRTTGEINYSWDNSSKVFSYNLTDLSSGEYYFMLMSYQ